VNKLSLACWLFLVLHCMSAAGAQHDKAAREATLRSEVKAAFDRYYEWFSAGRTDLIAENAYNAPAFFLGVDGPDVRITREDVKKRFDTQRKALNAQGYLRSEMLKPTICVLNENAAIVSGRYLRYRKDGSVLGEFGATYIMARMKDGWRVVTLINHTNANKIVTCSK